MYTNIPPGTHIQILNISADVKFYINICRDGFQSDLLFLLCFSHLQLFKAKAPALDAQDWTEHCSTHYGAYSHHDEWRVVAV